MSITGSVPRAELAPPTPPPEVFRDEGEDAEREQAAIERAEADEARITAMFDAHYAAIWRTVRRLGVAEASVDDAVQRVFLVATRRLAAIARGHEARYLYGIAVRIASEVRRRDPRRREVTGDDATFDALADDAPGPEASLIDHEARAALDEVLSDMPDELRAVLVLVEIEGLTVPELAEVLGVAGGTAASRLRRAREAFSASARRHRARLASRSPR